MLITKYKYILNGKENGKYCIFFESYKWFLIHFYLEIMNVLKKYEII